MTTDEITITLDYAYPGVPYVIRGDKIVQWEGDSPLPTEEELKKLLPDAVEAWNTLQLTRLKARKKDEIAQARWGAETGGVEFNNVLIATDRESQSTLTGAITTAMFKILSEALPSTTQEVLAPVLDAIPDKVNWKGKNAWIEEADAMMLLSMGLVVRNHVQACFDRENALKVLVDSATTPEEIEVITWEVT